ncbi:uncharacterized protein LOC109840081 [Asparagus officinalis]|nr:uncharacterized protein LOC109840081 [Asparagus officinalis]XP_020264175.1 uncharacterized protein LOC109840081 [Asparagus officinalis]
MIQWRPSTITRSSEDFPDSWRDVLLTCCSDGTVRLWSEIDNGRTRKYNKGTHEHKSARCSFHVGTVIEMNQSLGGTLGKDIFIEWVIELGSVISKLEGDSYCLSSASLEQDQIGKCEWLISVGPTHTLTFWAIHCLDDMNPLRFPRVTLWKKQDLKDFRSYNLSDTDCSNVKDQSILIKAVALRNRMFGPPVECSFVQLLPNNSVSWSQLYSPTKTSENRSLGQISKEKSLSHFAGGVLNQDGHTGIILELSIHPYCEIELAASLDSHGVLLFWSLPTISNWTLGMQMLGPTWKPIGRISSQDLCNGAKYSSLRWAPSVLDDNLFLLLGYIDGIDCFLIKLVEKGKKILCNKVFTVPFASHSHGEGPPDQLSVIPLPSSCGRSFLSNGFLLFAIWTKKLQALSWKVILHCADPSGSSCGCSSVLGNIAVSGKDRLITSAGKFYATVDLGSSLFPDEHNLDHIISISVTSPNMLSVQQRIASYDVPCSKYHMATGCSDGTVKLWKMVHAESSNSELKFLPWELVGIFAAHEGPVSAVSLSCCGGKVATVSMNDRNSTTSLHIWEPICLISGGDFLLEDAISLIGPVTGLSWLSIGNGHLLLAVCLPNELHLYSEKRTDLFQERSGKSREMQIWCCIALSHTYPASRDFSWGPKVTPVLIHDKYFSLLSQWLFIAENGNLQEDKGRFVGAMDQSINFPIFSESDIYDTKISLKKGNKENGVDISTLFPERFQAHSNFGSASGIRIHNLLDLADRLCETLPIHHPMSLLQLMYSGNWKRVYVVLEHLVDAIKTADASATSSVTSKSGEHYCYVPQIDLSSYFKEIVPTELYNKGLQWGQEITSGTSTLFFQNQGFQFADDSSSNKASANFSSATSQKYEIVDFIGSIEKSPDIKALRNIERTQLLAIVDLLGELKESTYSSAYDSLDKPGRRFWVAVRFQSLYTLRKFGRLSAEGPVSSRLLAWALQSDCHDNLLGSLLSSNPSWPEMRSLGVGFWFTNASQLRTRMEKLARSQYLTRKDPKDCALLYLALNRLQVLTGLFKISKDEKDKPLVGFLSRNFQEEKNKAAALKNAYVLMGRHQLELAVAFFLLGGDSSSAVTVCAKNLGDEQLALVICRLIEGQGGQLERQLISNVLIPNAVEKEDFWLASLLEWALGNYSCSITKLLDSREGQRTQKSAVSNFSAFLDPDIGQYFITLASKNNMKNSLGVMVLSKLATLMSAKAFNRCGFPLEALECFSSSLSVGSNDRGLSDIEPHMIFHRILRPFSTSDCNWLLSGIADALELNAKLGMSMQFISKLLKDHPSFPLDDLSSCEKLAFHEHDDYQDEKQVYECTHKLHSAISIFEQKYLVESVDLANMILVFVSNKGLLFHGYLLLHGNNPKGHDSKHDRKHSSILDSALWRFLLKACREISIVFSRYIVCCNLTDSILKLVYQKNFTSENRSYSQREFCLRSVISSMRTIRRFLKLCGFHEGLCLRISPVLDLFEYCVLLALRWLSRNVEGLIVMAETILNLPINHQSLFEVRSGELMNALRQSSDWMVHDLLDVGASTKGQLQQSETSILSIADDEMWPLIGVCLWIHLSGFANHQLSKVPEKELIEGSTIMDLMNELPVLVAELYVDSMSYLSSSLSRQLASFIRQKISKGLPVTSFVWLEELSNNKSSSLHNFSDKKVGSLELTGEEETMSLLHKLWEISVCPANVCENFVSQRIVCFPYRNQKFSGCWKDLQRGAPADDENDISPSCKAQGSISNNRPVRGQDSTSNNSSTTDALLETARRRSPHSDISSFHNSIEVLKRSGELLEAICFNSIDEHQVAVASNRKGLLFFNWKTEKQFREKAEYLWSESDWPQDEWGGFECKPVPTHSSQGIGLVNKSGSHLGLGGGTVGLGSLARPGMDFTGGAAFGIPGYAGIGAAGLGWDDQEDFELVDPPATVSNISTKALSHHPCRPFFLVGSSNTHIYLWEFGKDKAAATYGVLPTAHVPPPYALASVSALQFDHCGHRFASAALDGTVCTWQLEVGGRGNVWPTESSFCFSSHAYDVAYVAASGSILAAAGHSSNGVSVVVWDTLAPSVTSQASIVCHEGGARSLSVFDNDIGSGSISPLIVTGGKNGDVGVHDFRFIATGKTKRNKNSSQQDLKSGATHDNGMLWYIPRAHLGSITKVATIPDTSLFLTGSKDGDVKLWDAKRCQLVFRWQKMHDRHTFLQPNSRSIGGVVRAAVTDIQVFSHGFLTCGGDGSVKLVKLK